MREGLDGDCYGGPVDPEAVNGLAMLDAWFACLNAGGVLDSCAEYHQPQRGLFAFEEIAVVACAGDDLEERCSVCTQHSTGGVCVPVLERPDMPIGAVIRVNDVNPRISPSVDKEGDLAAVAEWALRPKLDPLVAAAAGDPVALASGELLLEGEDVAFPSHGVPFSLHRWYRSGASRTGALGPGWNHSYEERLEVIGDDFNRNGVPLYCTVGMPRVPNCMLHHSAGGSMLYVRKHDSPVYIAASGGFGTIVATGRLRSLAKARASAPSVFDDESLPPWGYEMRSPGGTMRTFDLTGVLLSITDELGFGVALDWQVRSLEETKFDGAWQDAQPVDAPSMGSGDLKLDRERAAAHNGRVNRLSRLKLARAVDSFGRVFELDYESYALPGSNLSLPAGTEPTQRRLRLKAVRLEGHSQPLVEYRYNGLPLVPLDAVRPTLVATNEAYLTSVHRFGLRGAGLADGTPIVMEYEYTHALFEPGGALHESAPGVWGSPLGEVIDDYFDDHGNFFVTCSGAVSSVRFGPAPIADEVCGKTWVAPPTDPLSGTKVAGNFEMLWKKSIADNIIRVRSDGEIELENYYAIDPGSPDFDRVIEQRYGAIPAPIAPQAETLEIDGASGDVHTWLTAMPSERFREISGIAIDTMSGVPQIGTVGPELANRRFIADGAVVPPAMLSILGGEAVDHEPEGDPLGPDEFPLCGQLIASFEKLPWIAPQDAAGVRADENLSITPTVKHTTLPCAAIAARHSRDAFDNDLHNPNDFVHNDAALHVNERRKRLEWDLALACRFVQTEDRVGVTRTWALNYRGDVLLTDDPSPSGTGRVQTKRRYNADSLLLEETRLADGSKSFFLYDGGTTSFQADRSLRRGNVLVHQELAGSSSSLELARDHTLGGSQGVSSRLWTYTYDPLFQQVKTARGPDLVTTTIVYDWEQLISSSIAGDLARLKAQYRAHTGVASTADSQGIDYDGDGGVLREISAQPVLQYVSAVNLGTSGTGDVGVRMRRDTSGLLQQTARIQDVDDPSLDFDAVRFEYYPTVADAEAGLFGDQFAVRGPLRSTTALRFIDSSDIDDLDETVVVYDAVGGVRKATRNDDVATIVLTTRNALGQIIEQEAYGEATAITHDARGHVVSSVRSAADTEPVVTVRAWGNQATSLGSCVEIVSGACGGFPAYALDTIEAARAFQPLPAPLAGARFEVPFLDDADRVVGGWNTAGARVDVTLNEAGFVTAEQHAGTPTTFVRNGYDSAGRIVREAVGTATADQLEWFHKWDTLGRPVATESRAALSQTTFNESVGTIERVGYDAGNRVVLASVVGDGSGGRRALAVTRTEVNVLGAPLFVHRFAGAQQATVSTKAASGVSSTDGWATESRGLDGALRTQTREREGVVDDEFSVFDGFGPVIAGSNTAYNEWTRIPRLRTLETRLVRNADDYSSFAEALISEGFDARGNLLNRSARDVDEGVDRIESNAYDGFGRRTLTKDPTGRRQAMSWDVLSQLALVSEQDDSGAEQRHKETIYDDAGRPTTERIDSGAPETNFVWDVRGRLATESSANHSVTLTRDAAGRLTEHERQATGGGVRTRSLAYGANRTALSAIIIDDGKVRTFKRDGLDRPVQATELNVVTAADSTDATFRNSRPKLTTTLDFDSLGRMTSDQTIGTFPSTSPVLPGQNSVEIASLTTTWPESFAGATSAVTKRGETLAFTYNDAGRMASVMRTNGGIGTTIGFHYLGDDWTSATTSAGRTASRTRNAFGEIRATALHTLESNGDQRFAEAVLRGPTGRIVATRASSKLGSGVTVRGYSYDALGRLSGFKVDNASSIGLTLFENLRGAVLFDEEQTVINSPDSTVSTSISKADNLLGQTTDESGRVYGAYYDEALQGVPPYKVNGTALDHDGFDRTNDDGHLLYTHDCFDRLVLVKSNSGATEELRFAYDGLGRRRMERRRSGSGSSGTTTKDWVLEYWRGNVIEEASTESSTSTGIALTTTHAPGLDVPVLTAIGRSSISTSKRFVLGANARGDVVSAITESDGDVVEEQDLDPWGERTLRTLTGTCVDGVEGGSGSNKFSKPLSACGPTATVLGRFGIAGARQHDRTKLVDLRNRVYAPHLRMFLTKDPLGNVDAEGLYAYVAADPINLRDPWGLAAQSPPAGPSEDATAPIGGDAYDIPGKYHWDGNDWALDEKCDAECARNARLLEMGLARESKGFSSASAWRQASPVGSPTISVDHGTVTDAARRRGGGGRRNKKGGRGTIWDPPALDFNPRRQPPPPPPPPPAEPPPVTPRAPVPPNYPGIAEHLFRDHPERFPGWSPARIEAQLRAMTARPPDFVTRNGTSIWVQGNQVTVSGSAERGGTHYLVNPGSVPKHLQTLIADNGGIVWNY